MKSDSQSESSLDPLFVSSKREAKWIVAAWLVNFGWVIGFSVARGYRVVEADALVMILGMPSWVFWGVFLPWIAVTLFTIWFTLTQMTDHPLEEEDDSEEPRDA
ncbi:MAG: YhdT family protein [Pirellulales bacterium]|nr:YhdT family protein [Pirellulales bacterium]